MNKKRTELARKYFIQTPDKPIYFWNYIEMALGGFLLLIGSCIFVVFLYISIFGGQDSSSILGVLVAFVCVGTLGLSLGMVGLLSYLAQGSAYKKAYAEAEPKASDEQMDAWLQLDRQRLIKESFARLDLKPDSTINLNDPLVIIGPVSPTRIANGKDGVWRFSNYSVVIIFLSPYHLAAYNCTWDFINAKVDLEETQEYHYQDIVSVSTLTSNSIFMLTTRDGKEWPIPSQQEFSLAVASGEKIRVVVSFPHLDSIFEDLPLGKFPISGAEKAISTLRQLLRDKKGGV